MRFHRLLLEEFLIGRVKKKDRTKPSKSGIKWRTIVSLFTSWMFLIITITGLVLYIVPQGRIAYWNDWRLIGLSKTDWSNIHIVASIMFAIAAGFHLYFNWKVFLAHVRRKLTESFRMRKEFFLTTIVSLAVVASAFWNIPPLGYLLDLNQNIKDSWIADKDYEPPFGHAELLSLSALCKRTNIDLSEGMADIHRKGFILESPSQSIKEIAISNSVSPKDIFATLKKSQLRSESTVYRGKLTNDKVSERFRGTGIGKKTISEACQMAGEDPSRCLRRLRNRKMTASLNDTVRAVASASRQSPIQVLRIMLVE